MTPTNLLPRHRVAALRVRRWLEHWCVTTGLVAGAGFLIVVGLRSAAPPVGSLSADLAVQAEADRSMLATLHNEINALTTRERAQRRASVMPAWDAVLLVIAHSTGDGVVLRSITVKERAPSGPPQWRVVIDGFAGSTPLAQGMSQRLDSLRLFSNTVLVYSRVAPPGSPASTSFQIECTVQPGSAKP
ncbi:MAG: hypothetical protein AAFX79_03755 [Planctomycetota bacterium]